MSGIFGIIGTGRPPASPQGLARAGDAMARAMAFRGPGAACRWQGADALLGGFPGRTTPWSGRIEAPVPCPESGLLIVADARLDGREQLCSRLGWPVGHARDTPDESLLLAAFRTWGGHCVEHLDGDFAFAVWDPRERRLFCARDPLGVRPFHYAHAQGVLVFASSARAVAVAGPGEATLDRARVADYLAGLEAIDETSTFYRDIHRLPRGHTAVWSDQRLQVCRYWRPEAGPERTLASDDDYLDAFAELFETAVADRMACTAPVASTLSGGLDSSTIVALARDHAARSGQGPLVTLSGISDQAEQCVETGFVRQVLAAGGIDAVLLRPADLNAAELPLADEPWDDMMTILACLYQAARARGHVAVFDGLDGEMLCALPEGYPKFLLREAGIGVAWREFRSQQRNYFRAQPRLAPFLAMAARVYAPDFARNIVRRFRASRADAPGGRTRLMAPALAEAVGIEERIAAEARACSAPAGLSLRETCAARVLAPYNVVGIERYNRVAARCGIEPRSPLLDRRLLEFCLGLPWNQKSRDGWSKYLLRRLAERRLSPDIAWRRGWEHIGWEFNVARLRSGRDEHLARLQDRRTALLEFLAADALDEVIGIFQSDDRPYTEDVRLVTDLAAWLDREEFL